MIPLFKVFMAEGASQAVSEVLRSGYVGEGPVTENFENKLSSYLKNDNVAVTNSGTSALHLALHIAIDGCKEAEILTTSMTCTATNTPIVANGAKIKWCDINPVTGNICPRSVRKNISPKTKAIIAVHWGGNPCELNELRKIADEYNVMLIEDCAHAFGSIYNNEMIGTHGDFCCFSFQAIKHLTTIDGGAITVRNKEHLKRVKLLRWFGIDRQNKEANDLRCEIDVAEAGYKFHMNDVNASVGIENLKHIPQILNDARLNASLYDEAFRDSNVRVANSDGVSSSSSSNWLYTIHVNNRDELMNVLKENNIGSSKVHSPNHYHTMFAEFKEKLPKTEQFEKSHLCIPVGWWVTRQQIDHITAIVKTHAR